MVFCAHAAVPYFTRDVPSLSRPVPGFSNDLQYSKVLTFDFTFPGVDSERKNHLILTWHMLTCITSTTSLKITPHSMKHCAGIASNLLGFSTELELNFLHRLCLLGRRLDLLALHRL